jgi:tetratricopeptide (TPR) repeat protein
MTTKITTQEQSKLINELYRQEKWAEVRAFILELLKEEPNSHWLLTRLSSTYYEEKMYDKALEYVKQAIKIAPHCPLVLWDYAGTLDMLKREKEALQVFKRLLRKDVNMLAHGECGEGLRWARSLVNDCRYWVGLIYASLGKYYLAKKYIQSHINNRSRNCTSIYNLREIKKDLSKIIEGKDPRQNE